MPQTLLLRIPTTPGAETEWLALDEAGAPTLTRQRGGLSLAAAVWRNGRVIALAPSAQILLAEPELPPGTGAKIARAVPFALEEQLTEDIDSLSFALGKRRDEGGTPVAVVSRSVLEAWQSELKSAGLDPHVIYSDIALMPENPGQTVLWLEGGRLAVRRPGALPFAVELSPVKEALVVAGVIADPLPVPDENGLEAVQPHTPESAVLYVTREDWEQVKDEFEELIGQFESLKVQLLVDGPLPWLSRSLDDAHAVNLLQGDFARATDYEQRWQQWRMAAVLAAVLLVVHIGTQAIEIRKAKRDAKELDTEISQIFSQTLPGEPQRDARKQMQNRLDRLRKSGPGPQHFLHDLQAVGGAVVATPKSSIDALSYREQSLDMRVTAPDLGAVSRISQTVGQLGLTADIQSSTPVSSGVEAHLQIRDAKGAR
jgi:general secretion pathway protein L